MEEMKFKVYVLLDGDKITRCEGGYTMGNIQNVEEWTLIDEGYGDKYNLCQSHYFEGGLYTDDGICRWKYVDGECVLRSDAEINAEIAETRTVDLAAEARAKRKKLLAETDWTQVLDAPISAECREAFRVYRQALRDITEQEGFPETIEWPTAPEVVKATPDPVDTAVDVLLGGEEA